MAGKVKKYLLISTLVVVTLLTAIGFGLVPVNLFLAKPAISKLIFDKLGMDLEIHGPLRIRFGPTPALTASGITLSFLARNDEPLIHIEQVTIKPRLQAFLDGDVLLRDIHIKGADIDYCQGIPTALQKNSASTSERGSPPLPLSSFTSPLAVNDETRKLPAPPGHRIMVSGLGTKVVRIFQHLVGCFHVDHIE